MQISKYTRHALDSYPTRTRLVLDSHSKMSSKCNVTLELYRIYIASKFSFIVMSGEQASLKRQSASSTESSSLVSNSLQQPIFLYKIKEMVHSSSA